MKKKDYYALLKKKPPNIIRGTRTGPDRAKAILTDGAIQDKNEPKETAEFATKTTTKQHMKNLSTLSFSDAIQ